MKRLLSVLAIIAFWACLSYASMGMQPQGQMMLAAAGDSTAPSTTISTTDPSAISSDALTIAGTASDAVGVSGCKWRIGSAPDAGNGTACTGTTSFSCSTSGYSTGANTAYVGCYDAAGNYGSDSITVNYTPASANATYIQKNGTLGKSTTLSAVASGSLIVVALNWSDANTTPTLSDGTNAPIGYSNVVAQGALCYTRFAYWLSSPKTGSVTYTWTSAGGGGYCTHAFEMGGGTYALISGHINLGAASADGSTSLATSLTSPSTSLNEVVAFGASALYANTTTTATIDGVAADQISVLLDSGYGATGSMSMRIMDNPGTYNAVFDWTGNTYWTADVIGFVCQ